MAPNRAMYHISKFSKFQFWDVWKSPEYASVICSLTTFAERVIRVKVFLLNQISQNESEVEHTIRLPAVSSKKKSDQLSVVSLKNPLGVCIFFSKRRISQKIKLFY